MNFPNFPRMPPKEPLKVLTFNDIEYMPPGDANAKDFLDSLRKIKERHPEIADDKIEIHCDDDGFYLLVTKTRPNHLYEEDMIKFKKDLESSRQEYAAYLEAYKQF